MQRIITFGLAMGLVLGLSSQSSAQVDIDCPQEIITALDALFPGEERGTNPGSCQEWKHGARGSGGFLNTRISISSDSNECGPEIRFEGSGQYLLVEPNDSVCAVGPGQDCPVLIPELILTDEERKDPDPALRASRTFTSIPARLNLGVVAFSPNQSPVFESAQGMRSDIGGGRTQIAWSNFPYLYNTDGDNVPAEQPDVSLRTGDGLCCDSPSNVVCGALGNPELDASEPDQGLARPRPNDPNNRVDVPPFVFEGGRGSAFRMQASAAAVAASTGGTFEVPGQLYGVCASKRFLSCDRVGGADPDAICELGICLDGSGAPFVPPGSPLPFPALCNGGNGNTDCEAQGAVTCFGAGVDSCDFDDVGGRVSEEDTILPNGESNTARCNHFGFYLAGNAVDPGTGRSTGCSLLTFYDVANEGFPQPGCLIGNFGSAFRPDEDCDGVEDDTDGDGQPGPDLCPFLTETTPFADANSDGIGDECQCADANGDGAVSTLDIGGTALCANGVIPCAGTIVDADGDGSTTATDIGGIVAVVNGGATTADLACQVNRLTLN